MNFKTTFTPAEIDAFVVNNPLAHYMHTSKFARFKAEELKGSLYYTGVIENDEIIATAIIIEYKDSYVGTTMYIPAGMCMDYNNQALLAYFSAELTLFASERKVNLFKIDPNVLRLERTLQGDIVEGGINNEHITKALVDLGYRHRGYNYAYDGSKRNRYTLVVDIDKPFDEFVKNTPKKKQASFKRINKLPITVSRGGKELAKDLAIYAKELAAIQHFVPNTQEYFEHLIEHYGDMGQAYVCKLNLEELISYYEKDLASNKFRNDPEARESCEKNLADAKENFKKYGASVVLDVAFYVLCNDTSYNLFNYANKSLTNFPGHDSMHYYVIQRMQEQGIKHYDLVGFSGVTNKSDLYYGLYDYKKTLGPDYIEQIGEFDLVINNTNDFINRTLLEARRLTNRFKEKFLKK